MAASRSKASRIAVVVAERERDALDALARGDAVGVERERRLEARRVRRRGPRSARSRARRAWQWSATAAAGSTEHARARQVGAQLVPALGLAQQPFEPGHHARVAAARGRSAARRPGWPPRRHCVPSSCAFARASQSAACSAEPAGACLDAALEQLDEVAVVGPARQSALASSWASSARSGLRAARRARDRRSRARGRRARWRASRSRAARATRRGIRRERRRRAADGSASSLGVARETRRVGEVEVDDRVVGEELLGAAGTSGARPGDCAAARAASARRRARSRACGAGRPSSAKRRSWRSSSSSHCSLALGVPRQRFERLDVARVLGERAAVELERAARIRERALRRAARAAPARARAPPPSARRWRGRVRSRHRCCGRAPRAPRRGRAAQAHDAGRRRRPARTRRAPAPGRSGAAARARRSRWRRPARSKGRIGRAASTSATWSARSQRSRRAWMRRSWVSAGRSVGSRRSASS